MARKSQAKTTFINDQWSIEDIAAEVYRASTVLKWLGRDWDALRLESVALNFYSKPALKELRRRCTRKV